MPRDGCVRCCVAPATFLLQFTEPRVVTENTMRHGLVVE